MTSRLPASAAMGIPPPMTLPNVKISEPSRHPREPRNPSNQPKTHGNRSAPHQNDERTVRVSNLVQATVETGRGVTTPMLQGAASVIIAAI